MIIPFNPNLLKDLTLKLRGREHGSIVNNRKFAQKTYKLKNKLNFRAKNLKINYFQQISIKM